MLLEILSLIFFAILEKKTVVAFLYSHVTGQKGVYFLPQIIYKERSPNIVFVLGTVLFLLVHQSQNLNLFIIHFVLKGVILFIK